MKLPLPEVDRISVITIDQDDTLWDNRPTLIYAERRLHEWLENNLPDIPGKYSIDDLKFHREEVARKLPKIKHDLTRLRYESLLQLCRESGYMKEKARQAMDIFLEARNRVTLYDDVIPFLDEVRKKYHVVALTNGNADVNAIGIGDRFTMALSASDIGSAKPEPDMFYRVFDELKVNASSVLHIGDEPETDVLGAHRAGVYSVWINRKSSVYPADMPLPDLEIDSLAKLLGPLKKSIINNRRMCSS